MRYLNNFLKEDKLKNSGSVFSALKKYKNSAISEMRETKILVKILITAAKQYLKTKDFNLSDEDKKFIKSQSSDILKLVPLIVFQIVPGSSIATPFILKLSEKLGIKLKSELPDKYKKEIKTDGEIDELVDSDGSPVGSNVPMLKLSHHPRKTMDQTARMSRVSQFPFIRVYYGESEEDKPVLDEEDMSGAFGDQETKNDRTYSECMKTMKKLGVDDIIERDERCKTFGFEKKLDRDLKKQKKRGKCKNCFTKRRLAEKEKVDTLIDEILIDKKEIDDDIIKDNQSPIFRLLKNNLESIKKIAKKENLSLNKLIQILKKSE